MDLARLIWCSWKQPTHPNQLTGVGGSFPVARGTQAHPLWWHAYWLSPFHKYQYPNIWPVLCMRTNVGDTESFCRMSIASQMGGCFGPWAEPGGKMVQRSPTWALILALPSDPSPPMLIKGLLSFSLLLSSYLGLQIHFPCALSCPPQSIQHNPYLLCKHDFFNACAPPSFYCLPSRVTRSQTWTECLYL